MQDASSWLSITAHLLLETNVNYVCALSSKTVLLCLQVRTKLGSTFMVWDVGGQDKLRPLWRSYTRCTDGIIFVIDSTKEDRLEEAKLELQKICKCTVGGNGVTKNAIPVLVLANKQDLPAALDTPRLETLLGLKDLGNMRQWHLQPTCAITGDGLQEGMDMLQEMIVRRRRQSRTSFLAAGGRVRNGVAAATNNNGAAVKSTRKVRRSHSHHY
jgi:signal recognition particle receptor subunit beta